MIASLILGLLAAFVWFMQLASVSHLSGSDAAGNSLSEAFAAIEIVILWLLLGTLVLVATVKGRVSMPASLPALLAIPASGVAALTALDLLAHPAEPPYLWPMIISAAVPPLILLFCVWAVVPPARRAVPSWFVAAIVWGATLLFSTTIWPFQQIRASVVQQQIAEQANWAADFAKMPRDAPLWDWIPFLDTPNEERLVAVIQAVRQLPGRQEQAETMLDRDDFPLWYLGRFDLISGSDTLRQGPCVIATSGRAPGPPAGSNQALCGRPPPGHRRGRGDAVSRWLRLRLRRGVPGVGDDGDGVSRPGIRDL